VEKARNVYREIASNKRRSVIVVVVFFLVWVGIGAIVGLLIRTVPHSVGGGQASSAVAASSAMSSWAPVFIGVLVCGVLAILGIVYSLTAGARIVLRTSGAVPINSSHYQHVLNLVDALAIGEGIPAPSVYLIEDPSPNAFATGISPDRAALTFTTGLLAVMDREELEGVISHEMSHIKNHDIRLLLVVGTLIGLAVLLSSVLWRTAFWGSIGENDEGGGNQLLLVLVAAAALLAVVGFIFGPLIRLALSRRREALADVDGVELTRNPLGLLNALKKLQANDQPFKSMNHATASMCIDDPLQHHESWYHRLFDTHPPIADRIAQLETLAVGQTV
jgi:heat shock protein HtpX